MTEQAATPKIDVDTNVNPFNGISDDQKVVEIAQKLYDAGAFNPDGKPDPAQGQNAAVEGDDRPERQERAAPIEDRSDWHDSYEAMDQAERHAEQTRSQKAQQVQQLLAAGQQAHQQLLASYQSVNWNQLDPQVAASLQADYQAREQQIQQHMANAHAHAQGLASEYLAVEREKAMRLVPEWRDPKNFAAAKADMLAYANKYGISQADIAGITDARHLVALYHASQVGKAPAPRAPSVKVNKAKKAEPAPQVKSLLGARERFMNSPQDHDAQSAYAQRLLDAGA